MVDGIIDIVKNGSQDYVSHGDFKPSCKRMVNGKKDGVILKDETKKRCLHNQYNKKAICFWSKRRV